MATLSSSSFTCLMLRLYVMERIGTYKSLTFSHKYHVFRVRLVPIISTVFCTNLPFSGHLFFRTKYATVAKSPASYAKLFILQMTPWCTPSTSFESIFMYYIYAIHGTYDIVQYHYAQSVKWDETPNNLPLVCVWVLCSWEAFLHPSYLYQCWEYQCNVEPRLSLG